MTTSTNFRSIVSASAARRTQVHHDPTFDRPALVTSTPAPRPVCTSTGVQLCDTCQAEGRTTERHGYVIAGDRPVSLPSSGGLNDVLYGRAA